MTQTKPPIRFQQRLDGNCVLVIFKDRTSKLVEIPLGNDEPAARKLANAIMQAIKDSDGEYTD